MFVFCTVFHEVHRRNYLTAINCPISLHSSLPVAAGVLSQPPVREAGCWVFVLAQFLNNRKSLSERGGMEGFLPANMVNLSYRAVAGARGTKLH